MAKFERRETVMFMINRTRLVTALLGIIVLFPITAVGTETPGNNARPWFEVEMILFTRSTAAGEPTRADAGVPNWANARALQPGVTPPLSLRVNERSPTRGGSMGSAYALLPKSALQLAPEAAALRRSKGALSPVLHLGWRQPIATAGVGAPLYIQSPAGGGTRNPELQGLIKLSVNRYLHVAVDILLNQQRILGNGAGAVRFQASRRMRSGELHYLDHPRMGILIEIRRHALPKPPPPAEETTVPAEPGTTKPVTSDTELDRKPRPAE